MDQPHGDQEASKQQGPSAVEWLVGAISTLLVLTGIGFLVYEAWSGTSVPPLLNVRAGAILPQPAGGYAVEIVAGNQGGRTVRDLLVEGRLFEPGGKEVEVSEATLSWVPAHAERKGGLFFSHDPRRYRLELNPQGYDLP